MNASATSPTFRGISSRSRSRCKQGTWTDSGKWARPAGPDIILDESLTRRAQLDSLDAAGRWLVNVRVSKMGGLHRSLALAAEAAARGIGVIVGAQVGKPASSPAPG